MRRIAVDFDGTLVEEKWPEIGDWLPGAKEALYQLAHDWDEVVIHTCRVAPFEIDEETPRDNTDQLIAINSMLAEARMPKNVYVWTKPFKPPAEVYLDNRAVAFTGDWNYGLKFEPFVDLENPDPNMNRVGIWQYPRPSDRHPNSQRFHELLAEAGMLHDMKQKDYGRGDDPFANVRSSAEWGMPAWVGAMVRLNDKVKRLQTYARNGTLANEGVVDSFQDIAVYALIAQILWEQEAVIEGRA